MSKFLEKLGSWRTTVAGLALGISILSSQISYALDDDPVNTKVDFKQVTEGIAAIGLGFAARDSAESKKARAKE